MSFSNNASLDQYLGEFLRVTDKADPSKDTSLMQNALRVLLRDNSIPLDQKWNDVVDYARAIILTPRDDASRAKATWSRSCSSLSRELMCSFGPSTIRTARAGCASLIKDFFHGDSRTIPHVDKKTNFLRNWQNQTLGGKFYPSDSLLAVASYESGTLVCALTLLAWATPEQAVKLGSISHFAVCDDYAHFTGSEYEVRIRMIALAIGAAYEHGGWAANALIDGSLLQATGTGSDLSISSIMAWRAVSGNTEPYTGSLFGKGDLEESSVSPKIMMAMHDLLDWRSDTAAGNHENGVSGVYGLGFKDPFHVYLEAILEIAVKYPVPSVHSMLAMTYMHYTAARYGSYEYRSPQTKPACDKCIQLLRRATEGAKLEWAPKCPPQSFAEGAEIRTRAKAFIDCYEEQGLAQDSLSWLQHLISSGKIWMFDLFCEVETVDVEASWA